MAPARLWAALVCVTALMASCTSDGDAPEGPQAEQPNVVVPRLPTRCEGVDSARQQEITFTAGGSLYALDPSSFEVRCLLDGLSSTLLSWGAEADRVLFASLQTALSGGRGREPSSTTAISPGWSRPTGSSVIYISQRGSKLLKAASTGGDPEDISFLKRHDEVVYHPAGTHIVVIGKSKNGFYGIFLADNLGKKAQPLARAEDARKVLAPAFSHDGRTLFFVGVHSDHVHLHAISLAPQRATRREIVDEGGLATLDTGPEAIARVVPSELANNAVVAYRKGSCKSQTSTYIWTQKNDTVAELRGELSDLSTEPVGWLGQQRLLVLARSSGCTGPADLYLWSRNGTELLRRGVTSAAARAILPPPPNPPDAPDEVVA